LKPSLEKLFENPPEEITLRKLFEDFVEQFKEDAEGEGWEQPSIHLENGSLDGYWNVRFDPKPNISRYQCAYAIAVGSDHKAYSVTVDGATLSKEKFIGPLYNFERTLFHLYACGTRILIGDFNADDVCYQTED
jgi:hypothetical protein